MQGKISATSYPFPACFVPSNMISTFSGSAYSLKLLMFTHKHMLHQRSLFDVLPRDLNGELGEGPKPCLIKINMEVFAI